MSYTVKTLVRTKRLKTMVAVTGTVKASKYSSVSQQFSGFLQTQVARGREGAMESLVTVRRSKQPKDRFCLGLCIRLNKCSRHSASYLVRHNVSIIAGR